MFGSQGDLSPPEYQQASPQTPPLPFPGEVSASLNFFFLLFFLMSDPGFQTDSFKPKRPPQFGSLVVLVCFHRMQTAGLGRLNQQEP